MVTRLKKIVFHSNGWGFPFKKNAAVERLLLSISKEQQCFKQLMSPVRENSIQLFEWLLLFIYSKLISRLIGQWYLIGFGLSNGWDYLFRRNFIQPPKWLCLFKTSIQPFWFKWPRLSILKEKLSLIKIMVQEINTVIRWHNGSFYAVSRKLQVCLISINRS